MSRLLNFYNGRSAMSYGLDLLKIRENSKILLPEIICDVAVKIFTKKNFKIQFYKLNKNFEPNWSQLEI